MGSPISLEMLGISPVHTPPPQPSDICPSISPALPLTESAKEKRAARMTDEELVRHVEGKLRPIGESLRHLIPYLREARARTPTRVGGTRAGRAYLRRMDQTKSRRQRPPCAPTAGSGEGTD